jgi:microcystin degradation protein MlrC
MTRVLVAGFKHETNTFSVLPTDLAAYQARGLYRGRQLLDVFPGTNTEIAGFLDGAKRHGWEPVLSTVADATPSGKLTRDCYETVAGEIVADARRAAGEAGGLAAVLLNLHGAMVAEHLFDGEGELLGRLRAALGPKVVIAATLDLHANVTDQMAREADILVSYRTYPHIDMHEIATETVGIVARTLAGEISPRTLVRRGRQIKGVDEGRTTQPGPMTEALAVARGFEREPGVLAASVNAGFYKADIPEVGPTAVIVYDTPVGASVAHETTARVAGMADRLVQHFWATRNVPTIKHATVAEAIARAKAEGKVGAPCVIADYADNPGGGGYSDSTGLLRGIIEAGLESAAMSPIWDPAAAAACHAAGVGATLTLDVGGKVDPKFGAPIRATGRVTHLSDGRFTITGPMATGMKVDMGPTACFKVGGVEIVIGSKRYQNYDLGYFRVAGIEPKERAVLAVKSMQHFRAAYAPIAGPIVVVDEGGGITSHDVRRLPWQHVRRPVFPLDLE